MVYTSKYTCMQTTCTFPTNKPRVAYNKGCRCERCSSAHKEHQSKYYRARIERGFKRKPDPIEKRRVWQKARRERIRERLSELKIKCSDCGWCKIPALLEFHHTIFGRGRGSLKGINTLKQLDEELKLGVFLCPNCHSERHYNPETNKLETNNPDLMK